MEIIVCVKRVPDVSEVDVEVGRDGRSIVADDLVYTVNEWDNFAIEEAIRLRDEHGGRVTALSLGDADSEEVLRRALAMGADEAVLLSDPAFEDSDPRGAALILSTAIARRPYDLILTGSVASDSGSGQVGGTIAAMLDIPQVSLATNISVNGGRAVVQHEVEGGQERVVEMGLPALVSVQTGINEPRYVSIRGIRKVASAEIFVLSAADLGIDVDEVGALGARVMLDEMFAPPAGKGAELLVGSAEESVDVLVERLREHGGL